MRTSAAGRAETDMEAARNLRAEQEGFTLVELMVTIAIVGLLSAIAILTLPGDRAALASDGERLGARLMAARDHALFSGRETAAIVAADHYRFEERAEGSWQPLAQPPLGETRFDDDVRAASEMRIGFDAVGLADPAEIVLVRGAERLAVLVTGNGEVRVDAKR